MELRAKSPRKNSNRPTKVGLFFCRRVILYMDYVNLSGIRGDTTTFNFSLNDCDGNPIDLNGATLTMSIGYGNFLVMRKEITSHIVPESGITYIQISGGDWENVPNGTFNYDLQLVDSYSQVSTLMRGDFFIDEDVTR